MSARDIRPIQQLLGGGGEIGGLIARMDWSATSVGPPEEWPAELLNTVSLLLTSGAEIVLFWGQDFTAFYNDAYAPTIGDKHPGALGAPAHLNWAELWDDLGPLLHRVLATGEAFTAKDRRFYIERHDGAGEEVFFDISYSPVRMAAGGIGGVLCIVSETTERVLAARKIAEERERLTQMFDDAPSFMAMLRGPALIFEVANQAYLDLIGKSQDEVIGRRLEDVLPEIRDQGFLDLLQAVRESGRPHRALAAPVDLARNTDDTLERRYVDFVFQPIIGADGVVTGIFIDGSDVTDRLAAEERLRVSEESLRLATDGAQVGTWDLDLVANDLAWSDRCKAMFGISPRVPVSLVDFYAGIHRDDACAVRGAFERAVDPAIRADYDVEYRTIGAEDGVLRWVAAKGVGVFEDGRCVRALGIVIDITARKAIEESRRESEARFRMMADTAPALIWMTDRAGRTSFVNQAFQTLIGHDPQAIMDGDRWMALVHPDDRRMARVSRRLRARTREPFSGEIRLIDGDGRLRWVHAEARPRFAAGEFLGYIGCAVDVTEAHLASEQLEQHIAVRTAELAAANAALVTQIAEREKVEATLRQMQRLEAIGQLTAGVAHDFNNLLTVVLGNVAVMERQPPDVPLDERARQRLRNVRAAAERGAALTAQLLAFARRTPLTSEAVDLNEIVGRMEPLLKSTLGGAIAIIIDPEPALSLALVDPTQVELIILNLAINARDAMAVGGTLSVRTANVTLAAPRHAEEPPAGDYVAVAVTDNGTGMSADVRARIFEPFFTTKEVGKGSGLGLAQVYGFAKQSGGGVRVDTATGRGTTITVYLPRTTGESAGRPEEHVAGVADPATDVARVLLLDDDHDVREVAADELRQAGFEVVEASEGAEALRLLDGDRAIGAIVADFAMPGMNGAEFAQHARGAGHALPVLFVTGYADRSAIDAMEDVAVLQKPYRTGDVPRALRRLLGRVAG